MAENQTHATIIRVFQKTRACPNAFFNEDGFLGFLMEDGRTLQQVRNGFRSLSRLNRFYDSLQLECAVCLGANDAEKNWSVAALAAHIDQKKANRPAQIALTQQRVKAAGAEMTGGTGKIFIFVLIPFLAFAWIAPGNLQLKLVLTAIGFSLLAVALFLQWREVRFYIKLLKIISR